MPSLPAGNDGRRPTPVEPSSSRAPLDPYFSDDEVDADPVINHAREEARQDSYSGLGDRYSLPM